MINFSGRAIQLCPVCGGSGEKMPPHPEVLLYRCGRCTHCFGIEREPASKDIYGKDYFEVHHRNWFAHPNLALFDTILGALSRFGCSTVLDVGCGNGNFLRHAAKNLPETALTGIDIKPPQPAGPFRFVGHDLSRESLGEIFDAVISLAVIEHIDDVQLFLDRMIESCADDGLIVIMTVSNDGLVYRLARLLRRIGFGSAYDRLYSRHHLNHFSKASLGHLLRSRNLRVLEVYSHNSPIDAVDYPANSEVMTVFYRLALQVLFALGRLTGATLLQTSVCVKDTGPRSR